MTPERLEEIRALALYSSSMAPEFVALREVLAALDAQQCRPISEWHEDMGNAIWWKFPIDEPPYIGSPLDLGQTVEVTVRAFGVDKLMRVNVGGWPGYHTHFTTCLCPAPPFKPEVTG